MNIYVNKNFYRTNVYITFTANNQNLEKSRCLLRNESINKILCILNVENHSSIPKEKQQHGWISNCVEQKQKRQNKKLYIVQFHLQEVLEQ